MIQFFIKGGVFMYPILLCSVLSLGFFIYKLITLKREKVIPSKLVEESVKLFKEKRFDEVYSLATKNPSPLAKILMVIVKNIGQGKTHIKESVEEVGRMEVIELESYVDYIGTIAGVATLLGLLGTISGLIKIFSIIGVEPVVNPAKLAGGISEALNTTAFGLVVAIPSVIFHRYLDSKVNKLVAEMESMAVTLIDIAESGENEL
ncbi:MAG: MotA/TolQ/ExbB proton channel family protein [Proteobacteria bacterium]|nr:MotA/TolQ/ExbB proton channel family protein [Pseudomonadota bacterium]